MIFKRISIPTILWVALLVSACGGGTSNEKSSGITDGATGYNGESETGETNGVWQSVCTGYDDSGNTYTRTNIRIEKPAFETTVKFFSENTCQIPKDDDTSLPGRTVVIYGTFVQTGGSVSTELGSAQFVNLTTESVIFDDSPAPVGVYPVSTEYDLFLVSGQTLYTGNITDDRNGETHDKRPLALDLVNTYTMQSIN